MESSVSWIINGLVALAGILGLFLAANAVDPGFYAFGLLLFVFGVLFVFGSIKKAFDESEATAAGSAPHTA
jgi:hypothetical protein